MSTKFYPHRSPIHAIPMTSHIFRCFLVRFDNTKRHGRYPVQHYEAYGVEFPEGEVTISTHHVPRKGYESMTDLLETLSQWGNIEVEDLGEVSA